MNYAEIFNQGFTYARYRQLVHDLFAQGKVTGPKQSQSLLDYTKLNLARMDRWDKTYEPNPAVIEGLAPMKNEVKWLVISEGWCGDAAQNLPLLAKIAEATGIEMRIVLRDEHLDLIDAHLTNGGRAIPKLVVLDNHFNPIASWGPRPAEIQTQVVENKKTGKLNHDEMATVIHTWYARNKGAELQRDIVALHQLITANF